MSTSQRAVTACSWGIKAGMVRVWAAGKTVWSRCYTRAISEHFRDKGLIYKELYKFICLLYFLLQKPTTTYRAQSSFSVIPIIAVATAKQKMTTPKNVWIGKQNARSDWPQTGSRNVTNPISHCNNVHQTADINYWFLRSERLATDRQQECHESHQPLQQRSPDSRY